MKEIWKDVVGYEGYYKVSSLGRVKSLNCEEERIMQFHVSKRGYARLQLCKNGNIKAFSPHRLVAEAFLRNKFNYKTVNHKNGIKDDNRVENLEWATHGDNLKHAFKLGLKSLRGEKNTQSKLTEKDVKKIKILLRKRKLLNKEIAKKFNISVQAISSIKYKRTWSYIK